MPVDAQRDPATLVARRYCSVDTLMAEVNKAFSNKCVAVLLTVTPTQAHTLA